MTGTTLNSCPSVLKKSGAINVMGVALSRPLME